MLDHIRAILFDLDGVLIETELQTFKFYQHVLAKEYSILLPDDYFKFKAGRKSIPFFEDALTSEEKKRVNYKELIELKRECFNREIQKYVGRVEGGRELLEYLKNKGYILALTSQNERRMVSSAIEWLDISEFFTHVLTIEDISKKKPNPEIYLKAAQELNLPPESCIVIEDSIDGIAAVKAAGMACIALYHDYMPADTYTKADIVVKKLRDIDVNFIGRLSAN